MRISVAMATWNGERFIDEQLESIARQSRLPDELVISDDASTDATLEIAERFARRAPFRVVIQRNDHRVGVDNFFRAMNASTGDLIALCDQDDVWHPDKLARCERPFATDDNVALTVHSARVVDASLRPQRWSIARFRRSRVLPAGSLAPFAARRGFTLMFRSVFVMAGNIEDRPLHFFSDNRIPIPHDVWANLVCGALGSVALLPDALALYRRHYSNTTGFRRDTRAKRMKSSLLMRDEEAHYCRVASAAGQLTTYLETFRGLADELGRPATAGLERAIQSHRRYARAMERRASAYAQHDLRARATRIARHAIAGDYAARASGGLGPTSLARDLTVGLSHRRSRRPTL